MQQRLRAIRRLRYGCLALLGAFFVSEVVSIVDSAGSNPSGVWMLANATAIVALYIALVVFSTVHCPRCGNLFHVAKNGTLSLWRTFARGGCLHCGFGGADSNRR